MPQSSIPTQSSIPFSSRVQTPTHSTSLISLSRTRRDGGGRLATGDGRRATSTGEGSGRLPPFHRSPQATAAHGATATIQFSKTITGLLKPRQHTASQVRKPVWLRTRRR